MEFALVIFGGLGVLVAIVSLVRKIWRERVRLRIAVDVQRSGIVTFEVWETDQYTGANEVDFRKGITVLVAISNPSVQSNTVAGIEAKLSVDLETVPPNAGVAVFTPEEGHAYTYRPDEWKPPFDLAPWAWHQANLIFLLPRQPQASSSPLPILVTVSDAYGKRYEQRILLNHFDAKLP